MVPEPVMLGFVNGLAIVIGISQLSQFKTINDLGQSVWISGDILLYSIRLCNTNHVCHMVFT